MIVLLALSPFIAAVLTILVILWLAGSDDDAQYYLTKDDVPQLYSYSNKRVQYNHHSRRFDTWEVNY